MYRYFQSVPVIRNMNSVMRPQVELITEFIHGPWADVIGIESFDIINDRHGLGYSNVRRAPQKSTIREIYDYPHPKTIPKRRVTRDTPSMRQAVRDQMENQMHRRWKRRTDGHTLQAMHVDRGASSSTGATHHHHNHRLRRHRRSSAYHSISSSSPTIGDRQQNSSSTTKTPDLKRRNREATETPTTYQNHRSSGKKIYRRRQLTFVYTTGNWRRWRWRRRQELRSNYGKRRSDAE